MWSRASRAAGIAGAGTQVTDARANTQFSLPVFKLVIHQSAWPRLEKNEERIELFHGLLMSGEELPPIEVVPIGEGRYLIADGIHRTDAALRAGQATIEAIVVTPAPGETEIQCAFRRALETATRTALPLTKQERRAAVLTLASSRPELSHRAVARLVGVSHDTVERWLREAAEESESPADDETFRPSPTADQVARQLVASIARLEEARGLADIFKPSRMGHHLARAFESRYGDQALREARRFAAWASRAVEALEAEGAS